MRLYVVLISMVCALMSVLAYPNVISKKTSKETPIQSAHRQKINDYQIHVSGGLFNCNLLTENPCNPTKSLNPGASEILAVIKAIASNSLSKKVSIVTVDSANPYEAAVRYSALFSDIITSSVNTKSPQENNIEIEWLPLTPAFLDATENGQCNSIKRFRFKHNEQNSNQTYSKLFQSEYEACVDGVLDIKQRLLQSAVVIVVNDSPTNRLVDSSIKSSALLGFADELLVVPMLAFVGQQALDDSAKLFSLGTVSHKFSEQNRTLDLYSNLVLTGQTRGFGIDETTALLVANSDDGSSADVAVLGKSGVAVIEPIKVGATTNNGANSDSKSAFISDSFYYSYWPSGAKANLSLTTDEITINHSAAVKESLRQSLPTQLPARFDDMLTNGKLRSLTQVMCMTDKTSSEGIQRDGLTTWQLSFEKTPQTRFTLYSVEKNQCAIERLKISVNKLKLKFG